MNINLHIERLILDGLPIEPGDHRPLQIALETELTRLMAQNGVTPGSQIGTALPSLRAGSIELPMQNSPSQLGQQIAGSVHSGISKIV